MLTTNKDNAFNEMINRHNNNAIKFNLKFTLHILELVPILLKEWQWYKLKTE